MRCILLLILLLPMLHPVPVFEFSTTSDLSRWTVVNDRVMGGTSSGQLYVNARGHGVFKGQVSLENNGGFSSLRYRPKAVIPTTPSSKMVIRVKGDGKRYQFRIKSNASDAHAYVSYFTTTTTWQTVVLPLAEMYPTFRGRRLEMDNYNGAGVAELGFLIGNKTAEHFTLEIAALALQ